MNLPRRVRVTARAKLNLGLAVGPRRADGFHDLTTVFQSISLADTLLAERQPRGFRLIVRHEPAAERGRLTARTRAAVPVGQANLALRAARLAARHAGITGGARLTLIKRIPAQAGMGGGSADAAAAMAAIFALYGVHLPLAERLELGAELGSDVPFALMGGTALGTGRGERLRPVRGLRSFRAIVAVPAWRVSTAQAFAELDRFRYGLTARNAPLRFGKVTGRMVIEPCEFIRLGNSFESVLGARSPSFTGLCSRMREAGLLEPRMTGSGSAVFGLLARGASVRAVLDRLAGSEALYVVRSARRALDIGRLR
ncbi:MAG TPA: 4-(cytidine 5'-diphospho)-2-C-methyl-D-erythritol kinase [Thermoanaerobaculaceae bacterium]|nr:4-(cytidine 5'-diphospho)-2-C-methyl-D-erythritol kinase [Thermoanaerobaculaceae bacterium]